MITENAQTECHIYTDEQTDRAKFIFSIKSKSGGQYITWKQNES